VVVNRVNVVDERDQFWAIVNMEMTFRLRGLANVSCR
jgi:hypothetical protein